MMTTTLKNAAYLKVKFTNYTKVIKKTDPKDIEHLVGAVGDLNSVMDKFNNTHNKQFKSDS